MMAATPPGRQRARARAGRLGACRRSAGGRSVRDRRRTGPARGLPGRGPVGDPPLVRSLLRAIAIAAVLAGCGGGAADDQPDGGDCPLIDDQTLAELRLSMDVSISSLPGRAIDFDVGTMECCYVFQPVPACVTWSVTSFPGVVIDQQGILTIGSDVPHGTVLTVTADVDGRRQISIDVYVYTREGNPLVGYWREAARLPCGGGPEIDPPDRINELVFHADGRIQVTWNPFEIYVDYWGQYQYEVGSGALTITGVAGNYVPTDLDGDGTATVTGTDLVLADMWLGTSSTGTGAPACGHRFTR